MRAGELRRKEGKGIESGERTRRAILCTVTEESTRGKGLGARPWNEARVPRDVHNRRVVDVRRSRRRGPVASADEAWAIRGMWARVVNVDDVGDGGHGEGARTNAYDLRTRG
jgi:hypothetical protein